MGTRRKKWLAVGLSLVLAAAATACRPGGGTPAPDPLPTGVSPTPDPALTSVSPSPDPAQPFTLPLDPQGTWNPYAGSRSTNMTLATLLFDSLYELDNNFEPQPLLAKSAVGGEENREWLVELRQGITFSDGAALDAQSVCAAINAARGEKSLYAARLAGIKSVTAENEYTVRFVLNAPNARFPALLDLPIARVTRETVVGTGRYVLDGERLLAREPSWRGEVNIPKEIPLTNISAADELIAAFDSGKLGLTASDPTGADALGFSGSYQTWEYPTSTMLYLGFQRRSGICQDPEVRAALSLAIDRGALVSQVLGGHASVAALPAPPSVGHYDQGTAGTLGYDPLAAGEALDALGYTAGEDGVRYSGKRPLALKLLVNSDNLFKEKLGEAIAGDLEAAGLPVTVTALPWEEYKKVLNAGDFDLYLGETRLTGDGDLTGFFTAGSGLCYGGAPDRELAEAFAKAKAEGGEAWKAFYALYAQKPPFVTLCFKTGAALTQWGQVGGLKPTQGDLFYRLEDWTFRD